VNIPVPPASALADVLAIKGLDGVLSPPLEHAAGTVRTICGPARTVQFAATDEGAGSTFDALYSLLDADLTGQVVVVAGAEAVRGAVWGQILSQAASRGGAIGVLVAGAVRDVEELRDSELPLWASSRHAMGATGNAAVVGVDVPVQINDVEIAVGDVIVADSGGVVRLARDAADDLLHQGEQYAAAEREILQAIDAGVSLASAYERKRAVRRVIAGEQGGRDER
jgi:regulator of RNase E activity RraA